MQNSHQHSGIQGNINVKSSMRAVSVLVFLAVGVMVVLMYQAVRQELTLRGLKARALESSSQVKQKENDIVQVKMKIQKLNGELEPINTKREELTKKKEQSAKATGEADKSLKTCHTEKADAEKKKTEASAALQKVKDDQEAQKKKAQEEIQALKQQILERDKALCAFVDQTNEEGRKLCGITEAPK
ncbi:restin homolog isoform X1 [Oncorhynchus keta]|uniref:restin homolog isoform X1 n=1 Tax=Oncorhynchus gorbuscha TaxID=8017 RepID=UPI001EAEAE28|nr:restin homolog isoform X1 [Oncorhynchus gorbuscha]XP_052351436.1 restin homolog isoform X1 [Oncorhynchus keta]